MNETSVIHNRILWIHSSRWQKPAPPRRHPGMCGASLPSAPLCVWDSPRRGPARRPEPDSLLHPADAGPTFSALRPGTSSCSARRPSPGEIQPCVRRRLCAAPPIAPPPDPQGADGGWASYQASHELRQPLPQASDPSQTRLPPQIQASLQGPPSGFPPSPKANPEPTLQGERLPIPSLAFSAVPRPGPGS